MKTSNFFLYTLKNKSINNNSISYDLMIKAGLIRKLSSGLYIWMPLGVKILKKINNLIINEMNSIGGIELSIPILQPSKIWKISNRYNLYNNELFKLNSNNKKEYILCPTNEEIITNILSKEIKSKNNFPIILFQIKEKFRNELRCKNGIIRTKEFIMKDAYSFHINKKSLSLTYNIILNIYKKIFNKLNLKYFITKTNSDIMGGNLSHEFNIISNLGEKNILINNNKSLDPEILKNNFIKNKNYYFNIYKKLKSNNYKFNIKDISKCIKIFFVYSNENIIESKYIIIIINNNDELSKYKLSKLKQINQPISFIHENEIKLITKKNINDIDLFNINIPILVDYNFVNLDKFINNANRNNLFFKDIIWFKKIKISFIEDITKYNNFYNKNLKLKKSLEIAHIFKLEDEYSKKFNFTINNKNILMGCYGIGISRLIASIIEQNNNINGILLPQIIAPFEVALIPINMYKNKTLKNMIFYIYNLLLKNNIDVLLDDRKENIGKMLYDMELIGIPKILILNEENALQEIIEYKNRINKINKTIKINNIIKYIKNY